MGKIKFLILFDSWRATKDGSSDGNRIESREITFLWRLQQMNSALDGATAEPEAELRCLREYLQVINGVHSLHRTPMLRIALEGLSDYSNLEITAHAGNARRRGLVVLNEMDNSMC